MSSLDNTIRDLDNTRTSDGLPDFDQVLEKYLVKLHELDRNRNIIVYASGWLQKSGTPRELVSVTDVDIQALLAVCGEFEGEKLDLILHSPGGSPEAAEAIVMYLRSRFSHIRVIVPHLAMSAATMIACASDEIMLAEHSFLGPIDPQILLETPLGMSMTPAQAILDQFDWAQRECADPSKLSVWLPMLHQYGPSLLVQCESALEMSKDLVRTWLRNYMFKSAKNGEALAEEVSTWLSDHKHFKSHSRHIPRAEIKRRHMTVSNLEDDKEFEHLVLSVLFITMHAFLGSSFVKIVASHTGHSFVTQVRVE